MINFRDPNCRIMTPFHPLWQDFCGFLEGPAGCDFKEKNGKTTWSCGSGRDKSKSQTILAGFPFNLLPEEIEVSLRYFEAHGGYCDCEILFNVTDKDTTELIWTLDELDEYVREVDEWLRLTQERYETEPDNYDCVYGCKGGLLNGQPCKCPNGQYRKRARRKE